VIKEPISKYSTNYQKAKKLPIHDIECIYHRQKSQNTPYHEKTFTLNTLLFYPNFNDNSAAPLITKGKALSKFLIIRAVNSP
jgi:hypothetical protein